MISSPVPYIITNGTVITTDPSITTRGVTDYGKIYRSPTDDGAFSLWAFGSTSAFDTALNIDTEFFADPTHLPIAAFKFQSLSLNGNPTIDLTNGGVTKLALIGVDGIISGRPGGTLTFTGLDLLALATVNGPINLTSDVSFQNLSLLAIYARGASSDLTVNSPISNIGSLMLAAERSIQLTNAGTMSLGEFDAHTGGGDLTLQIGGSLLLNGKVRFNAEVLPGATVASGANVTVNVGSDFTNSSATEFSRLRVTNQGHIVTGGNISVDITGNLTATGPGSATAFPEPGDFEVVVQNTNAQIDNGGNLNLTVGGSVNVNGLALYLQNYDETANPAGSIGTGGNIDVEVQGDFNANSYVDVFLNNRGGGVIGSGGNLTFNVAGALTIGSDAGGIGVSGFGAEFIISNRYDDIGGNTSSSSIGSSATLYVHAASISMAGDLFGTGISNRDGSTIGGDATATWDVTGNLTIQGTSGLSQFLSDADWFILNDAPHDADAQLTSPSGGTINGNATLILTVGGDANIAGDAFFEITNQRNSGSTAASGGSIIGNATINISAANFSVGGELDVDIFNQKGGSATGSGGSISGNAAINLNVTGNFAMPGTDTNSSGTPGDAFFEIFNFNSGSAGSGGFIGGDASITLQAGSIGSITTPVADFEADIVNFNGGTINGNATVQIGTTGDMTTNSLFVEINNSNGGTIGGNAAINMNVSGNASVTNDATIAIYGSDGAASAAINFNGGSYDAGGTFSAFTDGAGTITFNNASVHADVLKIGALGTNGVLNIGGGTLSADTTLKLYANSSTGTVNFIANVTLTGASTKIIAGDTVKVFDSVVVTIGMSPADIYTNNAHYSSSNGGDGTTTGIFTASGFTGPAVTTHLGATPPPFDDLPPPLSPTTVTSVTSGSTVTSGKKTGTASDSNVTSGKKTSTAINVSSTDELLSLLNGAAPGPGGNITIPAGKSASNLKSFSRIDASGRLRADRDAVINRTVVSSSPPRSLP